jgi:hypothetical protein
MIFGRRTTYFMTSMASDSALYDDDLIALILSVVGRRRRGETEPAAPDKAILEYGTLPLLSILMARKTSFFSEADAKSATGLLEQVVEKRESAKLKTGGALAGIKEPVDGNAHTCVK